MYNCNEYLELSTACSRCAVRPINVNYRYLDDELAYLLENSDSERSCSTRRSATASRASSSGCPN
jgi:acyl-CoA synthetase (AMP-forming)/AMP-acid ligase II